MAFNCQLLSQEGPSQMFDMVCGRVFAVIIIIIFLFCYDYQLQRMNKNYIIIISYFLNNFHVILIARFSKIQSNYQKLLQNKLENKYQISVQTLTLTQTLAKVFSCEFCEISKNNFFHRTFLVAAPALSQCFKTFATYKINKGIICKTNHQ